MKKIIKKWGSSLVVRFSPEECTIYNLNEDDEIELIITHLNGNKKEAKQK